jgi:deoxycytidine triphosphate deaminase
MITGSELKQKVLQLLDDAEPDNVEGVKYDFRLGSRILKAKYGRPIESEKIEDTEGLQVDPGEVVFVLSRERLRLPMDVVAHLSPKRKLAHAGILTLGGFCVDPGYHGHLLMGLLNISSTPFALQPGKKLIAATFTRLTESECADLPAPVERLTDFPDELIAIMRRYQPSDVRALNGDISALRGEINSLREEIRSHESWYDRFQKAMDDLREALSQEVRTRAQAVDELEKHHAVLEGRLAFITKTAQVAWGVFILIFSVFAAVIGAWIIDLLNKM